jgi:DNA repair protein RadC
VTKGTLDSSLLHPREVFREAIRHSASSIILAHNHPSGDPTPSNEDIQTTKRLHQAGQLLGIDLLDHVILGDGRWVSLKAQGVF